MLANVSDDRSFIDETGLIFTLDLILAVPKGLKQRIGESDNKRIKMSSLLAISLSNVNRNFQPYSHQPKPIDEYFTHLKRELGRRKSPNTNRTQIKQTATEILYQDATYNMKGYFQHVKRFMDIGFN
ncbi:hypothetical protein RF11_08511 [Thelohanellus kitauei]|uniref:Uncharacterized protein n=1 Tax=Thelohanellus kitauei TaxID=669202 RepID=A0A0C2N6S1_THEKT|nr:hypothetical protein RF11_04469 [Thelohanellus kitauei]KII71995.1 hypothetical protein RF11_08511 [Thelohanellus kitauei]